MRDASTGEGVQDRHEDEGRPLWPFAFVWVGQAFSLLGSQLVQFALVWWLTEETGSATVLSIATTVALLPQIVIAPLAGALTDRWPRRLLLIVSDGLIALATLGLAALFALDIVRVWHIYLLMALRSAGGAFQWPAMQASTTLMVPERHLGRVAGLNQMLHGAATIITPPLGAIFLEILPLQAVLAIDVATAALAIGPLLFIAIPQPADETPGSEVRAGLAGVVADVWSGMRFVGRWPGLLAILIIAALINLLVVPGMSLLPLLVSDHFGGGAQQLAMMQTAWGVGTVTGGLVLGAWGGLQNRSITALGALTLQGVSMVVVGLLPSDAFLFAVAGWFCAGFMSPVVNGSFHAMLQSAVPPDMQGRVFTLAMSGTTLMSPIGLAVAGPVADAFGVPFWIVVGGVATVAIGIGSLFVPAIVHVEEQESDGSTERVEAATKDALAS